MNIHKGARGDMEDRLRNLLVGDVMARKIVTVREDQLLAEVAEDLFEKGITGAPVVDANGVCVGMITSVDFMRRQGVEETGAPWTPPVNEAVGHLMTRGAKTISVDAPLLLAARMMCDSHVHRLPVIAADGQLVGILTSLDIVAALVNAEDETKA
ncbi:MAG: CBS domain-containing protein [Pirellulales bacterium]|nr:CBS domain-containing protein [Pirellulales bacterium]